VASGVVLLVRSRGPQGAWFAGAAEVGPVAGEEQPRRRRVLPAAADERDADVLDRASELPSIDSLRALARGRPSLIAFSALTAGTVVLRWRVGPGKGRIVAEARRHYGRPRRGTQARLTLTSTPSARRLLQRLGNRLPTTPVAAFVEFRPAHNEPSYSERRTEGPRRPDNANVEINAGLSAERRAIERERIHLAATHRS
jgi:hypothetical protein